MNLLVLCTGNSARSILLESIFNHLGKGRIKAYSAGSNPTGTVHPLALDTLKKNGYSTDNLWSKSWDEFSSTTAPVMDVVITVCGNARNETCPVWPGVPLKGHWGIDDPAAITTAPKAAFEVAFNVLQSRAKSWLSLNFEEMDAKARQRYINLISESSLVM